MDAPSKKLQLRQKKHSAVANSTGVTLESTGQRTSKGEAGPVGGEWCDNHVTMRAATQKDAQGKCSW